MPNPGLRLTLALALALSLFAAACAPTKPASPRADPPPAPPVLTTTTPQLRTDGDLAQRHQRIVAEASRGGHQIVFLGASIMERWTTVGREPWDAVWRPRHAIDCGIGGDRTQHVLARLDDGLLDALAAPNNDIRWIVINIGSNNTDTDSAPDIAAGIEAIVAKLRARLPRARIILTLFPRGQWPNPLRDKIDAASAILASHLASDDSGRVQIMDMRPQFIGPHGEISRELMPDFLHPSAAGYLLWSNQLEATIPPNN